MREIKFRAWSGDKMFHSFTMFNGTVWDTIQDKPIDWHIMQFTGLKDKNGIDIYEGDIVKRSGNDLCVIVWRNDRARYDFKYKVSLMTPQWMNGIDDYYASNELEIIGNIHEHPHLL